MLNPPRISFALVLATVTLGCGARDSDALVSSDRPKVAFDGKPDPRFVGTWKTTTGSLYKFERDGSYTLDGNVKTPGGIMKNHVVGSWGYKDTTMQFKDANGIVVPYTCSLEGTTLKLTSVGTLKRELVLSRG